MYGKRCGVEERMAETNEQRGGESGSVRRSWLATEFSAAHVGQPVICLLEDCSNE